MTTATLLPPKRSRTTGWLAQLPVPAGVSLPALSAVTAGHPTQALVRWA